MFNRIFLILAILITSQVQATSFHESDKVAEIFKEANVNGTFVVYDVSEQRLTGYNQQRAETRFIPASTFKIANSLIGLSTQAVNNVDEVFSPYDGKPRSYKSWEKDMGLREAMKTSNVPVYQALARRIGLEQMQSNIAKLNYGNGNIGQVVDNFWLEGPLKISAIEQTRFLARLAQDQLPLPINAQAQVRDILKQEEGNGWKLYAKTGWGGVRQEFNVGWWVGWVEKQGKIYAFALNLETKSKDDLPKRAELARASLRALDILE